MEGAKSAALEQLQADAAVERKRSMKKKKSLPNILVIQRQRSLRSLKGGSSPPLTAAAEYTYSSPPPALPDAVDDEIPPIPSRKQSVIQHRIVEARKRRDEQFKNLVDVSRASSVSRHESSGRPSPVESNASRPSFPPRQPLRSRASDDYLAPRAQEASLERASYESRTRVPPTATFSKPNPIFHPSQGELDSFDFKLPPRPRTATISPSQLSPKQDPLLTGGSKGSRPRQVSDADSSWQKSPRNEYDWTPPWTALYVREQRDSGASGFSTGSSALDTQRSSVFTKASHASANTTDQDEHENYMDDLLDMYCAPQNDSLLSVEESPEDDENLKARRRSMMIAQAMEQSIDDSATSQQSSQHGSLMLRTPSSEEHEVQLSDQAEHRPPRFGVRSTAHDQYGFRKVSREVTMGDYDAWWSEYCKIQKHRTSRWKDLLRGQGLPTDDPRCFPEPSGKVRRFIQKGIPPSWRGNAWFFYAGGHEYLDRHPGRYQDILVQAQNGKLSKLDKDAIERDLHRTFPDNIHFKPNQDEANTSPSLDDARNETPILSALRRVLSAFATDHPKIGYCQSLNFLAGLLLLFLPEERAFWLLHIITTDFLPGTHETSLEGANVDLWVLMLAIRDALPAVWQKVGAMPTDSGANEMWQPDSVRLPPISLCTTSWFMSLFIGTLPVESVLRVWDLLFYDGAKTLFRVALAIFKAGEAEIKAIQDPMEIFQVVQSLPRRMIRCGDLMTRVTAGGRGAVSGTWVEKQRAVRKAFFAKERDVEVARKMSKVSRKDGKLGGTLSRKQSRAEVKAANSEPAPEVPAADEKPPALGEVPRLERVPTRKSSGWFVRRTQTIKKTAVTPAT